MEEIKAPKKERKFLKAIGNIGKVLAEELVMGIARKFIGKVVDKVKLPKKREKLSLLLLLSCSIAFAQFPSTGNKQRLGFQTTADGLVWRGSISDTASIQPVNNQNAWVILDTVNLKIYSFDFTSNVWNLVSGGGTTIDTTSLSNRIDLKVNISDTAEMLLPYFKDADTSLLNLVSRFALKLNISDTAEMLLPYASKTYVDTAGRFYARQDFTNVTSSTLTWTQTDTLVPLGVSKIMVYRNGQILLTTQYTIPTKTTVVIGATAYKVGENYTVIFPKGGGGSGGGGGGGSGSVTSISHGTGIIANPNPITSTGTISADTSFLFTQSDTLSLNLTSRFESKLNTTDTASLSTRIDAKGTGTVTSVGSGFGLLGGTITTTGTLRLDTSTIYARLQDSINVAIGGDTIKILKQEYAPALTSVLTWTITPKFPIQLKAYILVFRNGQLLNNDQYNLTDTNKITIVSTSFKIGANYTVATVSGIGSVGSAQAGNPVYPEAGIALSTGTTWASSITNNSSNWNTAFTDRLKWDGGSTGLVAATGRTSLGGTTIGQSMFTLTNPSAITFPRFNADNTVSALTASNFRTAIGSGTVTNVIAATTAGNPISITNNTTTPTIELLSATTGRNGYLTSTDWTTFNNKFAFSDTASLNLTSRFASKQNNITLTTTGTSGAASLIGSTLNIPQYSGGGGGTGTVTSVGLSAPSIFTVGGSPVTTSGTLALTYSGNALPLANGGTGATTQANARITLGGTTSGISLFTLTNSVSDKFIKVNSNNTITLLSADDTRTTIGAGTGTVSSVAMSVPTFLSVSGSPITSSGTLAVSLSGFPLPVLNGGTGGANAADARNELGAACKSCTETLTGNKTFSGNVIISGTTTLSNLGGSGNKMVVTNNSGTLSTQAIPTATQAYYQTSTFAIQGGNITFPAAWMTSYSSMYLNIDSPGSVNVQLPAANESTNKFISIKNISNGIVSSVNSSNNPINNIQPLSSTTLSSVILTSGGGKWTTIVSDGTNWIKMAGN